MWAKTVQEKRDMDLNSVFFLFHIKVSEKKIKALIIAHKFSNRFKTNV